MSTAPDPAELRRQGDLLVVVLPRRLDGTNGETVLQQVESALAEGVRHALFDCSATEFVSSAGIRVFTAVARRLRPGSGRVDAAGLRPMVRQVFEFAGIAPFLGIHADLAAALGAAQ